MMRGARGVCLGGDGGAEIERRPRGARSHRQHINIAEHPRLPQTYVNTRSPSILSPVHCAIATVFVALPKALSKLGFAL